MTIQYLDKFNDNNNQPTLMNNAHACIIII